MKPDLKCDIIVLGGGIIGLTMANLSALQGFSVALVEANPPVLSPAPGFDLRVSAINRESENILKKIGAWDKIPAARLSAYCHMKVWEGAGFGEISFEAAHIDEPNLGYILENSVILSSLWQQTFQHPDIHILAPFKPVSLAKASEIWTLHLDNQQKISAPLIIGADGARSWLREQSKIKVNIKDYRQSALVSTVETEYPHQATAWQRFLPEGPLALLPLSDPKFCSVVWSAPPDVVETRLQLSEKAYCEELGFHFDFRLGKMISCSKRLSFPLQRLLAEETVDEGLALIGDAAHVIHPLAGQGLNLGFSDAACLAEVLSEGRRKNYPIQRYQVLRRYERRQKGQTLKMIRSMAFFKELFETKGACFLGLRGLALNTLDKIPMLKKVLIYEALGTV